MVDLDLISKEIEDVSYIIDNILYKKESVNKNDIVQIKSFFNLVKDNVNDLVEENKNFIQSFRR